MAAVAVRHLWTCPPSSQLTGSGQPMHSASVFRRFSYCDSCFAATRLQIHFVFVTFELILDFIAGFVYAFGVHCTLHHNSAPNHNFLCIKSSITRFGCPVLSGSSRSIAISNLSRSECSSWYYSHPTSPKFIVKCVWCEDNWLDKVRVRTTKWTHMLR